MCKENLKRSALGSKSAWASQIDKAKTVLCEQYQVPALLLWYRGCSEL